MSSANPFWKNVLKTCEGVPRLKSSIAQQYLSEPIWYNQNILRLNRPVFYVLWFRKNIEYVNDLIDNNGKILSHRNFQENYNFTVSFIEYNGLVNSVPRDWITAIGALGTKLTEPLKQHLIQKITKEKKPSRCIYNQIRELVFVPPVTSQNKWKIDIPELDETKWTLYYRLAKAMTLESKMHFFQYQILHRTLVTNSKLMYFGIKDNNNCTFCQTTKESILHLFWDCELVKEFWLSLCDFIKKNCNINLDINRRSILFGSLDCEKSTNCILLWAKDYIYCCRCKEAKPECLGYQGVLKKNITIEKHTLNFESWGLKWGEISTNLGLN